MKLCSLCGDTKPLSEFRRKRADSPPDDKRSYRSGCKPCLRVRAAELSAAHPGRAAARQREWVKRNPEKKAAARKRYKAAHPDVVKEGKRRWQHSERGRETRAAWMERNGASAAEYQSHYRATIGRWKMIEKKYGLTREQYEAIIEKQADRCAICLRALSEVRVHIDHCHKTGGVRGILCSRCNQALGLLGESSDTAARAQDYLDRAS